MSHKNLSVKTKIPKILEKILKNTKINQIYNKFERTLKIHENFAVAVSGGPDSLSLAFLAKVYALKKKLKPKFLIVDHKLRAESSKEAKTVKKLLKKLSIDADILIWKGKKPIKNIQSLARIKRYQLLFERCDKLKIKNILLGHHQDDLFENFFIRMLRGSGLKGLISFDREVKIKNKFILRPLINQKKGDLIYISKSVFNFHLKDPTNDNEKYQRTKIRKLIDDLKDNGLDKKKFLMTINNLKSSNEVVNFYVNENLLNNTSFNAKSNKLILNKNFFRQPKEVVFRSFSDSIRLIGQKYYSVRGKKLNKLIMDMENKQLSKSTLGGCFIEKFNQTVIISKES